MIKAIFFDVDGTLISHTISDIPPSALAALRVLREKGILLFLSTGRHKRELDLLPLHGFPFDGYVTLTGHLCYDRDWNLISASPLPKADTAVLARAFTDRELPLMLIHADTSQA